MKNDEEINSVKNRIWLTAKARVYAESRIRRYDVISHLLLVALSVSLICTSIFKEYFPSNIAINELTLALSTLTLAISIVVWAFRYGEEAVLHRQCYLRLDELNDGSLGKTQLLDEYHRILSAYPNHTNGDYDHFVLNRTLIQGREIEGANGNKITWTWKMLGFALARFVILLIIAGLPLIAPVLVAVLLWQAW